MPCSHWMRISETRSKADVTDSVAEGVREWAKEAMCTGEHLLILNVAFVYCCKDKLEARICVCVAFSSSHNNMSISLPSRMTFLFSES